MAILTATHPVEGTTYIRWRILALLFAASFVAYILRTNMSIAGESMMADLGLSKLQLGMVLAAFAWGYAIFQLPGGVWGDVVGSRKALAIIAVLWGVVTVLTGLTPGTSLISTGAALVFLIVLRFLQGAVQAPLYPVTSGGTIANWFPVSGWAFPNGLTSTALTLGAAATAPLIAWLTVTAGWRTSFLVTAPLALVVAAWWWHYARDYPAEHHSVSRVELNFINANRPASPEAEDKSAWKLTLKNRDILLLAISYFCMNYVFYIFFNWFFIYLLEVRGFTVLEGGAMAAAPWLVGAVGATAGGLVCDRLSKRMGPRLGCRLPGVIGLALVALLLFFGATAENPYTAVALLSLCFGCTQFTEGAYWAATISIAGRHAAAAGGILNTGGNIVGGVGALLVPIIADSLGWVAALATGSVFAVIGIILWLFIRADRPLGAD